MTTTRPTDEDVKTAVAVGAGLWSDNHGLSVREAVAAGVRAYIRIVEEQRSEAVRPPVQVLVCDTGGAEKPVESKSGWWFVDANNPGNWPARKAWPTTPARVVKCNTSLTDDQIVWGVKDGNDAWLVYGVYKGTAEAACLALNELPALVAWLRKLAEVFPTNQSCHSDEAHKHIVELRDLLARIDAAGFDMTPQPT